MYELFAHTPESLTHTLEVAEKCHLEFPKHGFILPNFDIPPQYPNSAEYFKALCREGLNRKMHGHVPPEYLKQLEYEFEVIITMGNYTVEVFEKFRFIMASCAHYCARFYSLGPPQRHPHRAGPWQRGGQHCGLQFRHYPRRPHSKQAAV